MAHWSSFPYLKKKDDCFISVMNVNQFQHLKAPLLTTKTNKSVQYMADDLAGLRALRVHSMEAQVHVAIKFCHA